MENVSVDLKRHGFISVICKTLGIIAAIVFVLIAFPKKLSADVTLIDSGERADYRYEFYSDGELKLYGKFTEPKDIYDLYLEVDFQLKHINYLTIDSGVMQTGWLYENGNTYYLTGSGAMAAGWSQINGNWYWFRSNGAMVYSTSVVIGGKTYNFEENGVCMNP